MAANGDSDARTLAELRAKIDRIDEAMHRLLIDRGTVIEALIAAKGTARSGAAFRTSSASTAGTFQTRSSSGRTAG